MKVFAGAVRGIVLALVSATIWPWVVLAAVPVLVIGLLCLFGWSWLDILPTKAERIAKREDKARTLRAEVAKLRSE